MTSKKTVFNEDWLRKFTWIRRAPDPHSALCIMCNKTFSLSNMGMRAVTSHLDSIKHKKLFSSSQTSMSLEAVLQLKVKEDPTVSRSEPLSQAASSSQTVAVVQPLSSAKSSISSTLTGPVQPASYTAQESLVSTSRGLKSYLLNDDVTKAEIVWTLESIATHSSMRAAARNVGIFSYMFPDSQIAAKMQLQRDKLGYLTTYGLAPYFNDQLRSTINSCEHFVLGFDESLNKVAQRQQMDINVRFWNSATEEVNTRYLTSAFFGRTTASDLLKGFREAIYPLSEKKIFQLSMDGPNVNYKFLTDFKLELKKDDPTASIILQLGSCGLHTVHGAFKTGIHETQWDIDKFLKSSYYLFNLSPARRALYSQYSGSVDFPLKFCSVRWLANASVAQKAVSILPHLAAYVKGVEGERKAPKNDSFKTLSAAIKDPLLEAKLAFFITLANQVEPFLTEFQSDLPLAPFLHSALISILNNLMGRFVKEEVLKTANSPKAVDVTDTNNLISYEKIDLGFACRAALKKLPKTVKELQVLEFRRDCRNALGKMVSKLLERSPLAHPLTRAITCFDPSVAADPKLRVRRMTSLLDILTENRWLSGLTADNVLTEFQTVCSLPSVTVSLKKFTRSTMRLDSFWKSIFQENGSNPTVLRVMKMVLILSHGNSNVERGFSVNSECLMTNQREASLIARRIVYDAVLSYGEVKDVPITKALIHAARNSRTKYAEAKAKGSNDARSKEEEMRQKRYAEIAAKDLEKKKVKLLEDAAKEASRLEDEIAALRNP